MGLTASLSRRQSPTARLLTGGLAILLLLLWRDLAEVRGRLEQPRLFGMNIGRKHYDDQAYQEQLARLDGVVLNFPRGWRGRSGERMGDVLEALEMRNGRLLIGQYTVMNEAYADMKNYAANRDIKNKLDGEDWWLRNHAGEKVQWTPEYHSWLVNPTDWTSPDAFGRRFPEWLAERDYALYYRPYGSLSLWYFDNVFHAPRVPYADWDLDGTDEARDDPAVVHALRIGHVLEWDRARQLRPDAVFMGNADNDLSMPEYRGRLGAAFLEGLMGKPWSLEARMGWRAMMARYLAALENTAAPKLVVFNVWGPVTDYRFFRYAYTSCLLADGYFSFTDEQEGYSSVPWFDEYDVLLGRAIEGNTAVSRWQGVYRRRFEKGMVLVNTTDEVREVAVGAGYRRFSGAQAPMVNNGKAVSTVRLHGRDGIVLVNREQTYLR